MNPSRVLFVKDKLKTKFLLKFKSKLDDNFVLISIIYDNYLIEFQIKEY